jgi:serine acetyltransferase/GT2 family glycosyltransferase
MNPRISVVIATRNRGGSVVRLVGHLGEQNLPPQAFEIIVVDDGSPEPVAPLLEHVRVAPRLRTCRIPWSGQGAARHRGATMAEGDILVFVDDDMQVGPEFLAAHLAEHDGTPRAVVLGRIQPDPGLAQMPLFERYHARQLARWRKDVRDGRVAARGVHLCTGNVSMRREDYLAVGGFNATLERSEDRELGIRLEKHGCALRFGDAAVSVHSSDHADVEVWLRRAYLYGRFDRRIAALHPDADVHPWRFWSLIHPVSRPVVATALVWPRFGRALARAAYGAARVADRASLPRVAVTLTAITYALEYFRGLREECGSFRALRREVKRARPQAQHGRVSEWRKFLDAVRADHDSVRYYRRKYHGEDISSGRLAIDLVRKVGFQMLAWYRVMRLLDAWRIPVLPMLVSRLIRHLYGAEIHWKAKIAPGVSVVHGVGLVISHAAEIGPGCIFFQNVTLGESVDPTSGRIGAPRVGARVHMGPGSMLIGPIDVGAGTKLAAGAVLTRSVPPGSLVAAPAAVVTSRRPSPVVAYQRQHAV